jgi:hypothetical protein
MFHKIRRKASGPGGSLLKHPRRGLDCLGSIADRLYLSFPLNGETKMFKTGLALALGLLMCQPVLADEMDVARPRYYQYRFALPAERHVIEVVSPPYSARFIINGARFAGWTPACFSWVAGERIRLIAGDWNGRCVGAIFYNYARRNRCQTWCGW